MMSIKKFKTLKNVTKKEDSILSITQTKNLTNSFLPILQSIL